MDRFEGGEIPDLTEVEGTGEQDAQGDYGDTEVFADMLNTESLETSDDENGLPSSASSEENPEPYKPLMEAADSGAVSLNTRDVVEIVGRGLERMAAAPYAYNLGTSESLAAMCVKARDYMHAVDSGTEGADQGVERRPLTFEPDDTVSAQELGEILDKAARAGIRVAGDESKTDLNTLLSLTIVEDLAVSKMSAELRAYYGIDGSNPDRYSVSAALAQERIRAQGPFWRD